MFSRISIEKSTKDYWDNIKRLKEELENADAILIGAGAGLSTSAGLSYDGTRFYENFPDFAKKYGLKDMYSAGFYPFSSKEEYWAYWSRYIYINRYQPGALKTYTDLLSLVKTMDYFVLTTNVDHCFQKAGFDKHRLFYTQGDYGLWQCSVPCQNKTYDNETQVIKMVEEQKEMRIPTSLVPYCPHCGAPMSMNLRADSTFVQDEGWYKAAERYNDFLKRHKNLKMVFLELGVGENTPVIIKYPFWQMTYENKNSVYVAINNQSPYVPEEIKKRSVLIKADITKVLEDLKTLEVE